MKRLWYGGYYKFQVPNKNQILKTLFKKKLNHRATEDTEAKH